MIFASFEASDADQSGPNSLVHYSIVNEGPHGDLLKIPDPEKPIVVVNVGSYSYLNLDFFPFFCS